MQPGPAHMSASDIKLHNDAIGIRPLPYLIGTAGVGFG
jgi:hypothetical protein